MLKAARLLVLPSALSMACLAIGEPRATGQALAEIAMPAGTASVPSLSIHLAGNKGEPVSSWYLSEYDESAKATWFQVATSATPLHAYPCDESGSVEVTSPNVGSILIPMVDGVPVASAMHVLRPNVTGRLELIAFAPSRLEGIAISSDGTGCPALVSIVSTIGGPSDRPSGIQGLSLVPAPDTVVQADERGRFVAELAPAGALLLCASYGELRGQSFVDRGTRGLPIEVSLCAWPMEAHASVKLRFDRDLGTRDPIDVRLVGDSTSWSATRAASGEWTASLGLHDVAKYVIVSGMNVARWQQMDVDTSSGSDIECKFGDGPQWNVTLRPADSNSEGSAWFEVMDYDGEAPKELIRAWLSSINSAAIGLSLGVTSSIAVPAKGSYLVRLAAAQTDASAVAWLGAASAGDDAVDLPLNLNKSRWMFIDSNTRRIIANQLDVAVSGGYRLDSKIGAQYSFMAGSIAAVDCESWQGRDVTLYSQGYAVERVNTTWTSVDASRITELVGIEQAVFQVDDSSVARAAFGKLALVDSNGRPVIGVQQLGQMSEDFSVDGHGVVSVDGIRPGRYKCFIKPRSIIRQCVGGLEDEVSSAANLVLDLRRASGERHRAYLAWDSADNAWCGEVVL